MGNCAQWGDLVGHKVRIQKDGHTIRTGYVDAVTADADALWIKAWGVETRALHEKAQGHVIRPLSAVTELEHELA